MNNRIVQSFINGSGRLMDFIVPPRCACCRRKISKPGYLCIRCFAGVQPIGRPGCSLCGTPFVFDDITGETVCGGCLAQPPRYTSARAGAHYFEETRHLILGLKHGGRMDAALPLARYMVPLLHEFGPIDGLIPVPLHWTRLFKRRYNQAHILAMEVAKLEGDIPVYGDVLRRSRATPIQGEFGRQARIKNVSGAFKVPLTKKKYVFDKSLVVIDDVLTTGATAGACAKTLFDAGARSVHVLTAARVVDRAQT